MDPDISYQRLEDRRGRVALGSRGLSLEKRTKERRGAWVGRTQESLDQMCPPIYACAEGEEAVHTDV